MFFSIENDYGVNEDTDEEDVDSSDDEDPFLVAALLGITTTKRAKASQANDFESEMNAELSSTVNKMKVSIKSGNQTTETSAISSSTAIASSQAPISAQNGAENVAKEEYYDDAYFDSDSEEDSPATVGERSSKKKKRHPVISNDDLFYDPNLDQDDQDWVDKRRRKHLPKSDVLSGKKNRKSDAVLNCPACMTTLCDDCQRHDVYKHQFRAMFVMNCKVDHEKVLENKATAKQPRPKKSKAAEEPELPAEFYNPVRCSECNTEVAVFDKDEVYHFFNVLTSYS